MLSTILLTDTPRFFLVMVLSSGVLRNRESHSFFLSVKTVLRKLCIKFIENVRLESNLAVRSARSECPVSAQAFRPVVPR